MFNFFKRNEELLTLVKTIFSTGVSKLLNYLIIILGVKPIIIKRTRLILIFSFGMTKLSFTFSQTTFRNSVYNYQLTIPATWQVIPQKEVVEFAKRVSSEQGYNEGFYPIKRKSSAWDYPYILTNFMKGKSSSDKFEEFANNFIKSSQMTQIKKNLSEKYPELLNQLNFGEAYYDKATRRLTIKAQANVTGVGTVVAITTAFFTERGVFFLNFYERKDKFNSSLAVYNLFVSSVKIN